MKIDTTTGPQRIEASLDALAFEGIVRCWLATFTPETLPRGIAAGWDGQGDLWDICKASPSLLYPLIMERLTKEVHKGGWFLLSLDEPLVGQQGDHWYYSARVHILPPIQLQGYSLVAGSNLPELKLLTPSAIDQQVHQSLVTWQDHHMAEQDAPFDHLAVTGDVVVASIGSTQSKFRVLVDDSAPADSLSQIMLGCRRGSQLLWLQGRERLVNVTAILRRCLPDLLRDEVCEQASRDLLGPLAQTTASLPGLHHALCIRVQRRHLDALRLRLVRHVLLKLPQYFQRSCILPESYLRQVIQGYLSDGVGYNDARKKAESWYWEQLAVLAMGKFLNLARKLGKSPDDGHESLQEYAARVCQYLLALLIEKNPAELAFLKGEQDVRDTEL